MRPLEAFFRRGVIAMALCPLVGAYNAERFKSFSPSTNIKGSTDVDPFSLCSLSVFAENYCEFFLIIPIFQDPNTYHGQFSCIFAPSTTHSYCSICIKWRTSAAEIFYFCCDAFDMDVGSCEFLRSISILSLLALLKPHAVQISHLQTHNYR